MGFIDAIGSVVKYFTGETTRAISPEADKRGVDLNQNGTPDFIIDRDDPRYIECEKTAHMLKAKTDILTGKTYGELLSPSNPHNLSKEQITLIEYDIATTLHAKVHEQFGDYNKNFKKLPHEELEKLYSDSSLHDSINRQDSSNPPKLSEFMRGELICSHYSSLANILLSEAGMNVVRLLHGNAAIALDKSKLLQITSITPHDTVMSVATGNIIDFSFTDTRRAYGKTFTKTTAQEFNNGALIVADQNPEITFIKTIPVDGTKGRLALEKMRRELEPVVAEYNKGNYEPFRALAGIANEAPQHISDSVKYTAQQAVAGAKPEFSGSEFTPAYNIPAARSPNIVSP